ncbi:MAG: hypothetical protein AAGJ50_13465 [Pseudomonadota bacterium]
MGTDADLQERLTRYLADEQRFQIDMLIVRGISGEDVGQSLQAVTGRAGSIQSHTEKRDRREAEAARILDLIEQRRMIEAQLAEIDNQIEAITASIELLDVRLERIRVAIERLEAGAEPSDILASDPALQRELNHWMQENGIRGLDESNPAAVLAAFREIERRREAEQRELEERREGLRERREGLEAEAARLDGELSHADPAAVDKAAATLGPERGAALLEAAGRAEAVISLGVDEHAFETALTSTEENTLGDRDSYGQSAKEWDGMALGLGDLSAASMVEATPINAEPITVDFNEQAEGEQPPEHVAVLDLETSAAPLPKR